MNKIDGLNDINGRNVRDGFNAKNSTNSMNPINAINTTNPITTFLELCNPSCASLSFSPTEEDWAAVTELSQKHGLTSLFSHRLGSLGLSLPEDLKRKWIMAYLYQMGQERKARRQIKELKEILDPEGIPFILLKGTSAMLRLYPDQGLRTFCDIDILIPPEQANRFKKVMAEAGYKPSVILNSPEEEEVWKFESHLPAIKKEDSGLPIETHLSILGRKEKISSSAISKLGAGHCRMGGEETKSSSKGVDFWPKARGASGESVSPDSPETTSSSASLPACRQAGVPRTRCDFQAEPACSKLQRRQVGGETFISSFRLWNELWQEREETEIDGTKVYHLAEEHYIIHMLLHFEKHLRTEGNLEIKNLVDVLHAIKNWNIDPGTMAAVNNEPGRVNPEQAPRSSTGESRRIDWERLWYQARRWKVQEVISPAVATLNHHWQAGIPVSEKVTPFDLRELIPKEEELQKNAIQRVPAGFFHRLSKARELPGFAAKLRYLFHIFFPIRENLYWRYGLAKEKSKRSYYLLHLSTIGKRFSSGLLHVCGEVPRRLGFPVHKAR